MLESDRSRDSDTQARDERGCWFFLGDLGFFEAFSRSKKDELKVRDSIEEASLLDLLGL